MTAGFGAFEDMMRGSLRQSVNTAENVTQESQNYQQRVTFNPENLQRSSAGKPGTSANSSQVFPEKSQIAETSGLGLDFNQIANNN